MGRSRVGWSLDSGLSVHYEAYWKTWKEACHEELPSIEHAMFRERLLRLEEIHGDAIRKRFPPEDLTVFVEI